MYKYESNIQNQTYSLSHTYLINYYRIADAEEKLKQNKTEEHELTKNLEKLRNEKRVLHCRKEER